MYDSRCAAGRMEQGEKEGGRRTERKVTFSNIEIFEILKNICAVEGL